MSTRRECARREVCAGGYAGLKGMMVYYTYLLACAPFEKGKRLLGAVPGSVSEKNSHPFLRVRDKSAKECSKLGRVGGKKRRGKKKGGKEVQETPPPPQHGLQTRSAIGRDPGHAREIPTGAKCSYL